MPLPWLIGAAAAAVAKVAYDSYKEMEEEEREDRRRRRERREERERIEAAEKERQERERKEKRQALESDFKRQIAIFGQALSQSLPVHFIDANVIRGCDLEIGSIELEYNVEDVFNKNPKLREIMRSLAEIVSKESSKGEIFGNLIKFSELYKPSFQYGEDLRNIEKRVNSLDNQIKNLKNLKNQLGQLKEQ